MRMCFLDFKPGRRMHSASYLTDVVYIGQDLHPRISPRNNPNVRNAFPSAETLSAHAAPRRNNLLHMLAV